MAEAPASRLPLLLCWLSPAFPVGAFAYSHAVEWAVEAGDVHDEGSLAAWLLAVLRDGAGRSDVILLAASYRAGEAGDTEALDAVNDFALALAPSGELRLETAQQGRSFLSAARAAWPAGALESLLIARPETAYPVAFGAVAAAHGVPLPEAVHGFLTAFAGNLVSAGIRLAPVGQTAGQRVLARLLPALDVVAAEAIEAELDDIASVTFRADLGSLRHETQYTRLFRS